MLLWEEDFGRYGTDESKMLDGLWAQVDTSSGWTLSTANPRTGLYSLRIARSAGNKIIRRVFGASKTSVGFGYAIFPTSLPALEGDSGTNQFFALAQIRDASNAGQFTLVLGTDGGIVAYKGGDHAVHGSTLLGRSDPCVVAGSWNHFEFYAVAGHSNDGAIEVRINGVTVLNLTSVSTCNTGVNDFSQFTSLLSASSLGGNALGVSDTIDVADMEAWDTSGSYNNTFLGDNKVFLEMPVADVPDTGFDDWGGSASVEKYTLIDEIPADDDTSYIFSTDADQKIAFQIDDVPSNVSSIKAVTSWCRAKKTDAGTCTIQLGIRSNGTEAYSPDIPLTTSESYYEYPFETDPDTGSPWTPSAARLAELVYKRVA